MTPKSAEAASLVLAPPSVRLVGEVNDDALRALLEGLDALAEDATTAVIEISTLGGDAEVARRMVLEIDLARERLPHCRFVFLGKTAVYSSGVTLMAAFPREDRFLTADAVLLIHCRQLEKTVELQGPLRGSLPQLEALCHELRTGIALETENFERLVEGSAVGLDELREKALYNWYVPAAEAVTLGLVAGIVGGRAARSLTLAREAVRSSE